MYQLPQQKLRRRVVFLQRHPRFVLVCSRSRRPLCAQNFSPHARFDSFDLKLPRQLISFTQSRGCITRALGMTDFLEFYAHHEGRRASRQKFGTMPVDGLSNPKGGSSMVEKISWRSASPGCGGARRFG